MAVPVAMALDLKRGAGREPRRKGFGDTQTKLIEAEAGRPRIGQRWRIPGEFGDHLQMRVIAERANEKGRQP